MCNMYMRSRSIVIQLRVIQNLKECLTTLKPFCVMCAEYKTKSVGKTYFRAIQSVQTASNRFLTNKNVVLVLTS